MPEYLAPGVYLEEVPSGNKPIEGVSTSTAAFVGVAERGPVNDPTLVTSFAAYSRTFGGYLDHRVFTDGRDLLPYAVEGFFVNGGSRLYVTRVVGDNARFAAVDLLGSAVTDAASTTLSERVAAGADTLLIDDDTNISADDRLLLHNGPRSEYVTAESDPIAAGARIIGRLRADHAADAVAIQTVTIVDNLALTPGVDMDEDDTAVGAIANPAGLGAGDILRISDTADPNRTEFVTIAAAGSANISEAGLQLDHPAATTQVDRVTLANAPGEPGGRTVNGGADAGAFMIPMVNPGNLQAEQVIRIGGEIHVVRNPVSSLSIATTPTRNIHAVDTPVIRQVPLLRIHARHQGAWANALRITVRPASMLSTTVAADAAQGDSPIRLAATVGLGAGSVINVTRGANNTQVLRQRVSRVDTRTNEVELAGGAGAALQQGDVVRSVEYNLLVDRLAPDGRVVESEAFNSVGVDPDHNRYAPRIVGGFDRQAGTPGRAGDSELIRVSDLTRTDAGADVPGSADLRRAAPFEGISVRLQGGDDDLATVDDQAYIGAAAVDPADRTGVFTFENVEDVSIVAAPGRSSQDVQNALINHCERMRYRFAVLDSASSARLGDVQTQRQQFDTTRGALYYPWMTITDQFGRAGEVHYIPPSGHVVGIYARSDNSRGVHKSPANEVIRGVRALRTRLTKGEQDILNPRDINCLRDFSDLNRGLRVWGARTLSSDPEFNYVNVRRLFLFVEKSIERGLQFAVFEPNSEALWATVKRSITSFLTAVWRDGALEGTKVEEAFFVEVGLNTMSQNDIDNGRLIVLVGIAPVKPAEFVIIRIQQKTREDVA